jgi:hypothetical protein
MFPQRYCKKYISLGKERYQFGNRAFYKIAPEGPRVARCGLAAIPGAGLLKSAVLGSIFVFSTFVQIVRIMSPSFASDAKNGHRHRRLGGGLNRMTVSRHRRGCRGAGKGARRGCWQG